MKNVIALGLVALAGCSATSPRTVAGEPPPSAEESVLVLGVAPANYAVTLAPGKLENGVFKAAAPAAALSRAPKDGYIVARVASGQELALTSTTRLAQGATPASAPFGACGAARTVVFAAQRGKVVYLADVGYESMKGGGVDVRFERKLEKARQYLAANYPELAKLVTQGSYTLARTDASCKSAAR